MSKSRLYEMARRNLAHVEAGTIDQVADVLRVPAHYYFDAGRYRLELERVFKRVPVVLAFSAELREPGSYRALWFADVPVLLVRGADGVLRGFLNACSHRGAVVVKEGTGSAKRFTCPYHAWSYDQEGALVGIYRREQFGEVDPSCLGLTPLAVGERAGIVWGVLTPGATLDLDAFLCGYDQVLAHLGLDACQLVGRQEVPGPNWKIAYDGYLDFYHLPILHRESFGPAMPSEALYDAFGPHQRVSFPNPFYRELAKKPEDEWPTSALIGGVWTIFPHISIADFDAGGKLYMVSQLFPGATPSESVTVQNFLAVDPPDDARRATIDGVMKFLDHVVRNEDYYTGKRIQKALESGAKKEVLFGRNEGGGQRFHRFVEALLATDDSGLAKLYAEGVDPP